MQIAFYAPVAIVYRYARYRILSGFGHFLSNPSVSTWVLTLPSVLLFYIKNWLFPVRLSEYYDLYYQLHPSLLHVILPVSIVVAIASLIWMFRKQLGTLEAGYAAIWIMIPLLPALSFVVFYPDQLVHDRYFYLPSVGSSLLSALFIDRVTKSRRVVFGQSLATVGTAMVLTIVLATITFRTASYWMDGYTLFSRAHEVAPANLSAAKNLIVEFIERREYDKAQLLLESEYRKNSDDFGFALNLGRLQYFQKQYAKAEEYTRKSIALSPTMAEPYAYLGIIQLKENRPREAQASLNKAVELNPWDAHFRTSYGIVLAANGDCTGAMTQFNAALSLSPDDAITKREIFNCNAAKSPKPASPSQLIQR
jgi:tetratricopeptide (TPR) repeat protein